MASEDRFKQAVVTTLAKRAANICSNPDCRTVTSGPTDAPMGSINIGEAAHIYGANPGSKRYDESMTSAARSAISNAIWLCSNCHTTIDGDELRYPAGLLFEWQRAHEQWVAEQVGKAGAELRRRYEDRHLEEFGKLSYLAERLILEKGDLWEYRLTSEALRFEMAPILRRWDALRRGLYIRPHTRISREECVSFIQTKFPEILAISGALSDLINVEFARSWGEPGVAGDERAIVDTCRLFAEMCQSALTWEESVRFVSVPEYFEEVFDILRGSAGLMIEKAAEVPAFFASTFDQEVVQGKYVLDIELALPEGWSEKFSDALSRATDAYIADVQDFD